MNIRSFRVELLVLVVGGIVVLGTAMVGSTALILRRRMNNYYSEELKVKVTSIQDDFLERRRSMQLMLDWFASSARAADVLQRRDVPVAVELGKTAMRAFSVDRVVFIDQQGTVLTRSHDPDASGDSLMDKPWIAKALDGEKIVAIDAEQGTPLILWGASAVERNGVHLGAILLGLSMATPDFVDRYRMRYGTEVTLFEGDTRRTTTIKNAKGERIAGTKLGNPVIEKAVLQNGTVYYGPSNIAGKPYIAAYIPVRGYDDAIVGMLFMGQPVERVSSMTASRTVSILSIAVIITLVLSPLMTMAIGVIVIQPVLAISRIMDTVAVGDMRSRPDAKLLNRKDEIGALSRSIATMLSNVGTLSSLSPTTLLLMR